MRSASLAFLVSWCAAAFGPSPAPAGTTLDPPASAEAAYVLAAGVGTEYPTFAAARDAVRALRLAGTLARTRSVEIRLAPGDYVLDSTFSLTATDSGADGAPVV